MPNYALVHQQMQQLRNDVMAILQSLHLQLSGESIRAKAVEKILMEKKLMTEETLKKKMAEVIKELNSTPVKEECRHYPFVCLL